jgi:hypothetical protein
MFVVESKAMDFVQRARIAKLWQERGQTVSDDDLLKLKEQWLKDGGEIQHCSPPNIFARPAPWINTELSSLEDEAPKERRRINGHNGYNHNPRGRPKGSPKLDILVQLCTRPQGTTKAEAIAQTHYEGIDFKKMAAKLGYTLRMEIDRNDGVKRYFFDNATSACK